MLLVCAVVALVTGCRSVGYYGQAVSGQFDIWRRQEPIPNVLARTNTPDVVRQKLQLVLDLREFAARELGLQSDGHYANYADLGRKHVVWNVYASPEFSLEPKRWWYPVVGKLKYRGYFAEKDAHDCAQELAAQGYDVHVGGVSAYSTLGFFKDPVLNTFLNDEPAELAETLFHELAHQQVFAKGDTDFNEAFATAVGEEGVRRWMEKRGDAKARAEYELDLRRKDQFVALVLGARDQLKSVYEGNAAALSESEKRARKEAVIAKLRADYELMKTGWGGYAGYDGWFKKPINNARLGTMAAYYTLVPAFKVMMAEHGGDMQKFYAAAKALAKLPKPERSSQIAALTRKAQPIAEVAAVE